MTLPDRIRQLLGPTHAAIEQTGFARAMIGGTIDRPAYCGGLAQLSVLHAALEDALAGWADVAPLYRPADMARADAIGHDLAVLGGFAGDPVEATQRLCSSFREWAADAPWKLAGALYVLEGSRMGSMALVRPLSKALAAEVRPGTGLDYHLAGIATRPQAWQQFRQTLAGLPLTDREQADVCAGATATMDGLFALYAGLPVGTPEAAAV